MTHSVHTKGFDSFDMSFYHEVGHNTEQALEVCDRIVVLRLGCEAADQPVEGLTGQTLVGCIMDAERAET